MPCAHTRVPTLQEIVDHLNALTTASLPLALQHWHVHSCLSGDTWQGLGLLSGSRLSNTIQTLSVFGISSISINADSGARDGGNTSSFKGAEIAIVVDVSGSMASSIPSLRAATTKIIDTVYGTSNTKPDCMKAL